MNLLTYPRNLEGSILVLGETGTAKIGGTAMNQLEHWQVAETSTPEDNQHLAPLEQDDSSYETDSVYGFGHTSLYRAIAARMNGEKLSASIEAALIHGPHILDNLIILDAIHRSAQNNGSIIEL